MMGGCGTFGSNRNPLPRPSDTPTLPTPTGLAAAQRGPPPRGPPPLPALPGDEEPAMQAAVSEKTECGYCSFYSETWQVRERAGGKEGV